MSQAAQPLPTYPVGACTGAVEARTTPRGCQLQREELSSKARKVPSLLCEDIVGELPTPEVVSIYHPPCALPGTHESQSRLPVFSHIAPPEYFAVTRLPRIPDTKSQVHSLHHFDLSARATSPAPTAGSLLPPLPTP
jgi:hypothetical protein